ncbi:hypothetical protein GCM10027060_22760 [Nesterenkonia halophila]|uniref:DNA-3-methyladenine glycosylase family protein n=1 Tax=Nesterenkonia halophila TaxID=302044 RepID=UPI001292471E|nr:3-methyladenine DNA glycosylase [Nesterenkonia halophila]
MDHSPAHVPRAERIVDVGGVLDLPRTLGVLQRGRADPALQIDGGPLGGGAVGGPSGTPGAGAWLAFRQDLRRPDGAPAPADEEPVPVLLRLDQLDASHVRVRAWTAAPDDDGAAAGTAVAEAATLLGAADDWTACERLLDARGDEQSAALARVRRRHPGVRLPATGRMVEQLVTVVLEQKVTHDEARRSWRELLRAVGEHPPGPAPRGMLLPPTPTQLRGIPSWTWHRLGVQPPLAATVQRVAERASALRRLGAVGPADVDAAAELADRLTAIRGIGAWTAAETLQRSHGAADLVAVGDYHLAHRVGEALSGRRADDAGMLALLEPWRGHRQRVVRLIGLSGFQHQRRGPMLAPEDHRRR